MVDENCIYGSYNYVPSLYLPFSVHLLKFGLDIRHPSLIIHQDRYLILVGVILVQQIVHSSIFEQVTELMDENYVSIEAEIL